MMNTTFDRFERFLQGNEAVDLAAAPDAYPEHEWTRETEGRSIALALSAAQWGFAVRAVLRCDALADHPEVREILRELARPWAFVLTDELARDAQATLRDESWHRRGQERAKHIATWAMAWGCSAEHLTHLLVDAQVFGEWVVDVGFFDDGVADATRRVWLRESILADRAHRADQSDRVSGQPRAPAEAP